MQTLQTPEAPAATLNRSYRINSIDFLRGLVMIIMALDHTRDFFHITSLTDDPLNLETTTPLLFFTRWITHLCAPTFVFLSGTSAYLQSLRKSKKELSLFLVKRGVWLILAEVLIMTLGITYDITYSGTILQVIWAIGISMVVLGIVIRLPFRVVLALGLLIVLGHNLLDFWEAGQKPPFPLWYSLLHVQSFYQFGNHQLIVFYPFLPWAGVMMLGYCFGSIYKNFPDRSNRIVLTTGGILLLVFVLLRAINVYGDPQHWSVQKSPLYTFFSFIKTQKYPPSLLYLCVTLGISLSFLGLIGNVRNRLSAIITVYGRVPFLYYVLHFYILHLISALLYLSRGHSVQEGMTGVPGIPFKFEAPGEGYGLGVVYLVWIVVVISLYPVCRWFSSYKQNHRSYWLSYL